MNSESATSSTSLIDLLPIIIVLGYKMMGIHLFLSPFEYDVQAEGGLLNQLILGSSFLLALVVLLTKWPKFIEILKVNWLLLLFLIYTLMSCLWSPVPFISFKRWFQFLGFVLIGMAAISRPSGVTQIVSVLLWITAASLVISLVVILIHPSKPFVMIEGAWKGLYTHKNGLGAACALGFAAWLPALKQSLNKIVKRLALIIIIIALILLVGSRSVTALITSFAIFFVFLIISLQIPTSAKLLFLPVPFMILYLYLMNFLTISPLEYFLAISGRDITLTGRTELWTLIVESIKEHPLLGIGYNGFWVGKAGLSTLFLYDLSWHQNQSHNGYLDIINELGFIGFGLFIVVLGLSVKRGFQFMKRNQVAGITFLLIIITLLVSNFAETTFCRQSSRGWIAFIIAFVATSPLQKHEADTLSNSSLPISEFR
ncbi:MAG: O-antigen ligase family protein [bacterium]